MVRRLPPMVPLAVRSMNFSALSLCISCRLLFCSVPNRRTSLKSVCTISLPVSIARPQPEPTAQLSRS